MKYAKLTLNIPWWVSDQFTRLTIHPFLWSRPEIILTFVGRIIYLGPFSLC